MRISLFHSLSRFFLSALIVLILTAAARQVLAAEISLPDGKWTGVYTYIQDEVKTPVKFTVELYVEGDSFSGKVSEPNTFGTGDASFLTADLMGRVNSKDLSFIFMKKYDGSGGVRHAVFYKGKIDPETFQVRGRWEINGATGAFYMSPQEY